MRSDEDVLNMLEAATNEIEEVLLKHGVRLVYGGVDEDGNSIVHAQYEQMYPSGDLSIRSMEIKSPEF